ncbi:MAG: monovalent cation/H+ antiporter subunit D family protein [Acidimicrobiia bacterium]|nr:monovalent cation/H+ antiporter subunit D family protein [Acidimicrobiia bacterium]
MQLTTVTGATVLVPLVAAGLLVAARRRPNLREGVTLTAALVLFGLVVSLLPAVLDGETPGFELFSVAAGIEFSLRVDTLGLLFALLASFLWILTSIYAIGYMRGNSEAHQTRFYASFALCLSTVMGLAFSANLFTFFVFFELLTIATYPLVTHKGSPESTAAGRRYLAYLLAGGAALLLAMGLVYHGTGGGNFTPGGFVDDLSRGTQMAVLALLALGFGSKAAIIPLHRWLPSAMVAPTPVSALLHAVAVVKAGVFGFARTVGYVFGPEALESLGVALLVSTAAAFTIAVASLIALFQDNLKRRLAFSTIAHLSYIVLGLTLLSATAWTGGLLHIVNHAALKITLFFCAGTLYVHAHYDRVSQLDGIGRRMPITMAAFALASLGLAGLPPMGGFMSKWYLVLGGADADRLAFAAVMLFSGLLTAGYLFPIVARAFFRPLPEGSPPAGGPGARLSGEASPFLVAPLAITALVGLALGMGDVFSLFSLIVENTEAVIGRAP